METNIEKKLIDIFKKSGISITEDNKSNKIELNSMQIVNILLLIEDEFLLFLFEENIDFLNLKSFYDYKEMITDYIHLS